MSIIIFCNNNYPTSIFINSMDYARPQLSTYT